MNFIKWCETNNRQDLIEEYRGNIQIDELTHACGKKVQWKCLKCGNEWLARVADRTSNHGCPKCFRYKHTSMRETFCYNIVKDVFIDAVQSYKADWLGRMELDIYVPSKNFAIEYDGGAWHKNNRKTDLLKESLCKERDITLYRIREENWDYITTSAKVFYCKDYNSLYNTTRKICSIETNSEVILSKACDDYYNESIDSLSKPKVNKIADELLLQWDYDRNEVKPEILSYGTPVEVFWKCSKGHSYKMSVKRKSRGYGCPYCSNRKVLKGYNDLKTIDPFVASEWNYDKNDCFPENIVAGSNKKFWWKCSVCEKEWQTSPNARVYRKNNCPACGQKKAGDRLSLSKSANGNSLAEVHPELLKYWDYDRNQILPNNIARCSGKTVYWICDYGHSYSCSVRDKVRGNKQCPICKNLKHSTATE